MGSSAVTFVVCLLFKLCCCMYSPVNVAVLPTRVDNTSVLLAEVNIALLVEIGLARRHAYSMQVLYSEQCCKVPRSEKAGGACFTYAFVLYSNPSFIQSHKIHYKFRDEQSFKLGEVPEICGQVTEIRASAGSNSSTAQGSFCYS